MERTGGVYAPFVVGWVAASTLKNPHNGDRLKRESVKI